MATERLEFVRSRNNLRAHMRPGDGFGDPAHSLLFLGD